MIVQYSGDYLAAHELLERNSGETYYGHGYVLDQLGRINGEFGEMAILCCKSPRIYDVTLPSGLRVIGAGLQKNPKGIEAVRLIENYNPTHLVVLGPLTRFIRWGLENNRNTLCIFADSFEFSWLRRYVRYGRLVSLLNDKRLRWIGNHGTGACQSLANIGISPEKIIPWDWPHRRKPQDVAPKTRASDSKPSIFFAGLITKHKGVGDIIEAVAELRRRGVTVVAKLAGEGEVDRYRKIAASLGVEQYVRFLGLIPNSQVFDHMRESVAVVVPSRHAYPEGLPLTIYEALCARTPVVASDHPMFLSKLTNGKNALIYSAANPAELADQIERLLADDHLYSTLSNEAQSAWESLQIPVKWGDLLRRWLSSSPDDMQWLRDHRLSSYESIRNVSGG